MPNDHAGHDPDPPRHPPDGHGGRADGHHRDRGLGGALRYLRRLRRMWRSSINEAVVALVDPRPGERVVDIGAGMGAGAICAAATGADVIALEPTPFMRRILESRRLIGRCSNVAVAEGAAERIPSSDGAIDAIWAVNTMHHWVDVERGVAEIARVIRPGGRILLVDEVFDDPAHPEHRRLGTSLERHGFTLVDAERMGGLLRAAGLVDVDASNRALAGRPVVMVAARGAAATDR